MKVLGVIVAGALALASASSALAAGAQENATRLAKMLEGRAAGQPVSCIAAFNSNKLQVIESALVYDAGETLYVARPTNAEALDRGDVVVINRSGGQLCHTDIIRTVDRMGGFTTGVVFLGQWVPYRKHD